VLESGIASWNRTPWTFVRVLCMEVMASRGDTVGAREWDSLLEQNPLDICPCFVHGGDGVTW